MVKKIPLIFYVVVFCLGFTGIMACANPKIPVLMYHHLYDDTLVSEEDKQQINRNTAVITEERFRADMEYLKENGYTSLFAEDLIAIKSGEIEMPEKPIMITFDDGYLSNYVYAYPILEETGMKATISLITSTLDIENIEGMNDEELTQEEIIVEELEEDVSIDELLFDEEAWRFYANDATAYLTIAQCKEMYASGIIDFGGHTHDLHSTYTNPETGQTKPQGILRLSNETREEYIERFTEDLELNMKYVELITGQPMKYYAYPFGLADQWATAILNEKGIEVTTVTKHGRFLMSHGIYGLYDIPRINVSMEKTLYYTLMSVFL